MLSSSINVASHLARLAATEPDRPAIHVPFRGVNPDATHTDAYRSLTFRELHADSDALAHGLIAAGIVRGTRTAVMVPPGVDFFSLTFALLKIAAVPVLIDPGMGVRNLGKCLADAEPEAFIGIAKAHLARRLFGWAKKTIRTTVNAGRRRFFCHRSLDELREIGRARGPFESPSVTANDTAAILFTSGSTGVAKGVVYTHGIFSAQVEMLKATYGIEPGEVDLCTFPLFALFGPALGMTCVVPDMDASRPAKIDPQKAVKQIHQFKVTNMFGSPAVVRRLGEYGERSGTKLDTVRRVISAGAPVPAKAIETFAKMLPESTEIFTPYGATESLPVANISSREILGETRFLTDQGKGVCVGRPVVGMDAFVIPITDDAVPVWDASSCLPVGEIGEFVVRGPVVTKQYFNRPDQTRLAKIHDTRTGDFLHRMGDVGYFDERGRMWYCGRKSHRVQTRQGTYFTEQIEGVFNVADGVRRTALVGVNIGDEIRAVLCVELEDASVSDQQAVLDGLREMGRENPLAAVPGEILQHPAFPVDVRHNAKIFREKLAVWAERELTRDRIPYPPSDANAKEARV